MEQLVSKATKDEGIADRVPESRDATETLELAQEARLSGIGDGVAGLGEEL